MADDSRETTYLLSAKETVTAALQNIVAAMKKYEEAATKAIALPGADKAEVKTKAIAENIRKTADSAKDAAAKIKDVATELDTAADRSSKLPTNMQTVTQTAGKFAKALGTVASATDIIEASWESISAIFFALNNQGDKQQQAALAGQQMISQIPIVGDVIEKTGEKINRFLSATKNLILGEGFSSDKGQAERILNEALAIEKKTAKLQAEAEATRQVADQTKELIKSLRDQSASVLLSQQDQAFRNLEETSKQIDEMLKKQPNVDRFGTPTEAGKALASFRDNYIAKLSRYYKDDFIAKAQKAESELQAARLEGSDRTNDAELVNLQQSLREREREAARSSDREASISEALNRQLLDNFTRQSEEARKRLGNEFSADLQQRDLSAKGTFEAKQAADRVSFILKQQVEVIDAIKKLRASGMDEDSVQFGRDLLTQTQDLEQKAFDRDQTFEAAQHAIDRVSQHQGDLNLIIERTNRLYDEGKLSLGDATEQQKKGIDSLGEEVQRVSAEIDGDLAKGILTEEQAEELKRRFAGVQEEIAKTKTAAQQMAEKFQGEVKGAVDDFLFDSIKGTKTLGEAFLALVQSIADSMLRIVTGNIAKSFTDMLSGGTSGGGIFGAFVSGVTMAEGGFVPGVGDRDSVPAMLTPGEAVLPKRVVEGLGRDYVGRLIGFRPTQPSPQLPLHFASGGIVPQMQSQSRTPGVALATVIAGPQEAERFFKGGHTAVVKYFSQHAALYRTVLGLNG